MGDLGMTLYIYNLSQSSGVILLFWVKYKNLAPFTSLYLLSFVIALNISSRIFLLDIGFWIASCFISALETYQIFFWFPWFLMRHPLSSNWFCTISKVSFVSLFSWFFTWCLVFRSLTMMCLVDYLFIQLLDSTG